MKKLIFFGIALCKMIFFVPLSCVDQKKVESRPIQGLTYWKAKQIEEDVNFIARYFNENRQLTLEEENQLTFEQRWSDGRLEASAMSPEEIVKGLRMGANKQPLTRLEENAAVAKLELLPLVEDMKVAILHNSSRELSSKKDSIIALIKPTLEQTGYFRAAIEKIKEMGSYFY